MSIDHLRDLITRSKAEVDTLLSLIVAMGAAFGRQCDMPMQASYLIGLEGIPISDLKKGMARLMQTEQFMPTIAAIRKECGADVSGETRAQISYEIVAKAASTIGTYRSVVFDDPITNATITTMGGWVAIGEWKESEDSFTRAAWIKAYRANYEAKRGTMSAQLGTSDRGNGSGLNEEKLVRIGVNLPKVPGISYETVEKRLARAFGTDIPVPQLKGPGDE